jgi:hypothetical protein
VAPAPPPATVAPLRQPMLQPRGVADGTEAAVPGAPAGCQLLASIQVPYDVCEPIRTYGAVNTGMLIAERRYLDRAGAGMAPEQEIVPYFGVATASPPPADGAAVRCALACDGTNQRATWSFKVPSGGYRGRLTCTVASGAAMTADVEDAGPVPDGVGALWLTDLSGYGLDHGPPLPGEPDEPLNWLVGDNLCPAGQPTRSGQ